MYAAFLKPIKVTQFVLSTLLSDSRQALRSNKKPSLGLADLTAALARQSTIELQIREGDLKQAVGDTLLVGKTGN